MPKIPYGKYTKEFREEAVKLVTVHGHSIDDAALRISVPKSTLANWVRAHNAGQLSQIGKNYKVKSESELEIARLKRELAEVKMERDVLKKATVYFVKESQRGTR
jgi:transposase